MSKARTSQYTYSMHYIQPWARLLRQTPGFPAQAMASLESMGMEERLPATVIHDNLRATIQYVGDPALGLKAARMVEDVDFGALSYILRSAATVGEALKMFARYVHITNDAIEVNVEVDERSVTCRYECHLSMPRGIEDFLLGAFRWSGVLRRHLGDDTDYEISFTYPRPETAGEYAITFPSARLLFGQPHAAIRIPRAFCDLPLPTSDPKLHAIIRRHADQLLRDLPTTQSFTTRVRPLLVAELAGGHPSASRIASQLRISTRTLTRKLTQEGTSFKDQLDQLRRGMGLKYVGSGDMSLAEVAFLLGFSKVPAFHRAFKRWTGTTPLQYRKSQRG